MNDNDKIKQLEAKIEMLISMADKTKLNRLMPQQEIGTSVKVSIYRESPADEGRLVVGWSGMKHDVVKYTNKGEFEDQRTEVWFDGYEKVLALENNLKLCTKPETIALKKKEIEELKKEYVLEMSLVDFGNFVKADTHPSTVKGMEVINGEAKAILDFNDKEYRLPIKFLNL